MEKTLTSSTSASTSTSTSTSTPTPSSDAAAASSSHASSNRLKLLKMRMNSESRPQRLVSPQGNVLGTTSAADASLVRSGGCSIYTVAVPGPDDACTQVLSAQFRDSKDGRPPLLCNGLISAPASTAGITASAQLRKLPSFVPPPPAAESSGEPNPTILETAMKRQLSVAWQCIQCSTECIPVRRESRCLCGHRLKEHKTTISSSISGKNSIPCQSSRCPCKQFFFVVAEGAWVLRCRCKHKHTEHDCSSPPYRCSKCATGICPGFDSPWVCNCGHGWASHNQRTVARSELESAAELHDIYTDGGVISPYASDVHLGGKAGRAAGNVVKKKSHAVRQDGQA
jgi:hypothetical protein